MAKVPVAWINYESKTKPRGSFWDQGMVEDLLNNRIFETGYEFEHIEGELPEGGGIVVIGGVRNQAQYIDKINQDLAKLEWCVLFLTGDEEGSFPVKQIKHPNIQIWIMSPYPKKHSADEYSFLGTGYPTWFRQQLPEDAPPKELDWFFAGQITHATRKRFAAKVEELKIHTNWKFRFEATPGFTQGLKPLEYASALASAKVAPAPSGPETPDSFRLFEALEAAAVPIPDTIPPSGKFDNNYWTYFFGEEPPFPTVHHYDHLQGYMEDMLKQYPVKNNQVFAWWQMYKYKLVQKFVEQLQKVSSIAPEDDEMTVLMPTSPYSIHPSTEHIEQTIRDTRVQLPNSLIIIMIDGIRREKEPLRQKYEEYQRRLLWLCNNQWHNVLPLRFEEFGHQSAMTRQAIEMVKTPYIVFVEHDAPPVPDFPIEWDKLKAAIKTGSANVVRLHHESVIHDEHKRYMIGEPEEICGAKLLKTAQWSQRPHIASTVFYKDILERYFTDDSRAFIEHGVYGKMVEAYNINGVLGWNLWKVWIYCPDESNLQRSYDLNTRGNDPNYESTF